ncbi:hypothetical protein EV356DRAFT_534577 [Viridothelium virens]|uniref:PB1 domain-containing protein n=1 Tax=Viridothelium virens TaxID=1048519 RepID=A0A6A6H4L2_VIRVR|nr:hypothetical protein EV356DRAFT_534577 [Viridothelium virens]
MSLKQEIETWVKAMEHYDKNEFDEALKDFDSIADTSKILFNCGVIHATLGEHERAVECYQRSVKLDQYLAVAYFQQGVSNFLMGDFEEALANFNDTLLYLRGNNSIDYDQLGLKFKLYACETLFNRGLCYIYLQQMDAGMQDLQFAANEKANPDHDVIDEAIREQAEGYTVFSIPVGIIYRPNAAKVKNLKTKDYLGKARLVAATERSNTFTGFTGAEMKKQSTGGAADDRPDDKISFAASNLVKPGITSRRQQSEPPLNRNVFPPTPPPESESNPKASRDKRGSDEPTTRELPSRAQSVKAGPKPPRLELGAAAFPSASPTKPRMGTTRSASERPRAREDMTPPSRSRDMGPSSNSGRSRQEPPRRRYAEENESDSYPDDVYDMYSRNSGPRSRNQRPMYIDEEEEDFDDDYSGEDVEFDMVSNSRQQSRTQSRREPLSGSSSGGFGRQSSRRQEVSKIRVKVHADDTRYVMIGPAVEFLDFIDQIRAKFGLRRNFKVKINDDGDMITMGDQDDLDMSISTCRKQAQREKADMGKMEVWLEVV